MSAAGEFRVIGVVIQETPAFQALTGAAQNLWRAYKLRLGLAGIGVCYLGEMTPRCGRDATDESIRAAEGELIAAGYLEREGAVAWLVDGLADERFARVESKATRKGVQTRVASLPPCAVVERFRDRYADWFDSTARPPTDAPGGGLRTSAKGVSKGVTAIPRDEPIGGRSADPDVANAETERPPTRPRGSGSPRGSLDPLGDPCLLSLSSSDALPARAREDEPDDAERVDLTEALVATRNTLKEFPAVKAWVDAAPARHDLLAHAVRRVLANQGTPRAYVALVGMAVQGGLERAVSAEQLERNLIDWCYTKDEATRRLPAVQPRVFRRYLTGEDATQRQRESRTRRQPVAAGQGIIPRV